jgi:hypothetical protein
VTLSDILFIIADIVCIPVFFQEWSFINLSDYANKIAKIPCFKGIVNQCADDWVKRVLCMGFALKFIIAIKQLISDKNLNKKERSYASWTAVASVAECAFNLAILRGMPERTLTLFMFFPKFTGLIQDLTEPKHRFFTGTRDDEK